MDTEVLVIGGGATGAGVAWDLALRGVRVVLAEMGDMTTGTSGRYHGLLHSGGRYAVKDQETAKECIDENIILRRIAPHVVEDTGGMFVMPPGDDESYVQAFIEGCAKSGIPIHEISPAEAVRREPVLRKDLARVFEIPDGSCDSFDLGHALKAGAEAAGAKFLTYHRVDDFIREGNQIVGALLTNLRTGEAVTIRSAVIVNAAGPWAEQLGKKADVAFKMKLSRGANLAFNIRWVNTVINRLRKPGDGDIFVPVGTVSVVGTTSIITDDPADTRVEPWEVRHMLDEMEEMTPGISRARILRTWAGVRPLYDPGPTADGRAAARTFTILDHSKADDVHGMVTIIGGKLTTFRLMAEKTADVVCAKLNNTALCVTATTLLPNLHGSGQTHFHHLRGRLDALEHGKTPGSLICECEIVTAPQIEDALKHDNVFTLNDLRRDLRVGMGPCQGGFCAFRTAALRHEIVKDTAQHTHDMLREFAGRRFGGVKPLLWGHNLRQALLAENIYQRFLGMGADVPKQALVSGSGSALPDGKGKRVVIVGAGLAGLTAALAASEAGAKVELVAQGQGTLTVSPGWIETGDVSALAQKAGHPYSFAASGLQTGLTLLSKVLPISIGPVEAITATGQKRPVAASVMNFPHGIKPDTAVVIVGIEGWRDFFATLVADTLAMQGYQATAAHVRLNLPPKSGNYDQWPLDIAHYLDSIEGLQRFAQDVKPLVKGAAAAGFPAVLGFKPETKTRLAEMIGCEVFEIPTLPPSVPGMRLYRALRSALLDRGVRLTIGPKVAGLVIEDGTARGVQIETASERLRTIYGDAVILCTGGLYGGGLESDYQGKVWETLAHLHVAQVPAQIDWFNQDFLSGQAQPIHYAGVQVDDSMRPLNADGSVFAANVYAAGRLLSGYSPVSEGSTEGVDIATGTYAVMKALVQVDTAIKLTV